MMSLFTKPDRMQMAIVSAVWLAGMILLILAITDLFRQPFFANSNPVIWFLMLGATAALVRVLYQRLTTA
jgi:peptidoglycan/LPS O-acetylase OafA/YrhL